MNKKTVHTYSLELGLRTQHTMPEDAVVTGLAWSDSGTVELYMYQTKLPSPTPVPMKTRAFYATMPNIETPPYIQVIGWLGVAIDIETWVGWSVAEVEPEL